jgi:glycogen(starch) synthase
MFEPVADSVSLPAAAASEVRRSLGMEPSSRLRIAFIAGSGDVVGTFDHWMKDCHDPRIPVIAYSTMFYAVVAALGAEALILAEQDRSPREPDPRFRFAYTEHPRGRRGLGYRLDEAAFTRSVLKKLAEWPPDLILVGTDASTALISRLPRQARVVLTAHNVYWPMGRRPEGLKASVRLWFLARALRRLHSAVCTSQECAEQIASLGSEPARMFVETPQVLDKFFSQTRLRSACARLVYLGRIEVSKGILDLIDAFESIATSTPELTLDIAGTGSADALVRARIAASANSDRIRFHGLLGAQQVHFLLGESDLLVCPTRTDFSEGLALVVVEAAVHGVPAVLSSIVPAKDLLPGACVTFPANDTASMTAQLRELTTNRAAYAGLCAALGPARAQFLDRSTSWGSMLYRAMIA